MKAGFNNLRSSPYLGAMTLGLNDSLVEIMGAAAGYTSILQNTRLVGAVVLVTAIAGALSMAASEHLEKEVECNGNGRRNPNKAAAYTGLTYFAVAAVLAFPYFVFTNIWYALGAMLVVGLAVVTAFSYYSVKSFVSQFPERVILSFGIAGVAFVIGLAIRLFFGVT